MNLTGGIILFAVFWFMTFLVVLPIGMRSQAEAGEVEPGTPASAPAEAMVGRKARITTLVAAVLWAVTAAVILSGAITLEDIDMFHRLLVETPR